MKKRFCCFMALLLCLSLCTAPALADYSVADDTVWAYTPIYDESQGQITNLHLACAAIDGWVVGCGETFSFNEAVGERSKEAGYRIAINGRGTYVRGGGVSQLATTLNMAVSDFSWTEAGDYMTYGDNFTGNYVDDGEDAVVTDYANDHDYTFTSWYPGDVMISAWIEDNTLYCTLSGYESSDDYGGEESNDVLSEGITPMPDDEAQRTNILQAAYAISGTMLEYGDAFSFNDIVGPRTTGAGYVKALNGRGVKVVGGGVAQVASTVYLAAKKVDSITLDYVRTYGDRFTGGYVSSSDDAIVTDYNAGIDFSFTYYGAGTLIVYVYEEDGLLICDLCEIYD